MLQRITMIFLLLILVLGGGFYAYNELMPTKVEETMKTVYSTKEVVKGDISVGVEVTGSLDSSRGSGIRVPGERRYDGGSTQFTINEVLVEEGDSVKEGDVIAILDSTEIESQIEKKQDELEQKLETLAEMTGVEIDKVEGLNPAKGITMRAPISGRINELDVSQGKELELGHVMCRIVDDSKFKANIKLSITEYNKVKKGDKVYLKFPNFDGFYEGQITKLNPNPVPNNDTDDTEDSFAKGFVHTGEVEGKNPGLVQREMEFSVGIKNENSGAMVFFGNAGEIAGFAEEKKVLNTVKGVITEVHVENMENVEEGDKIATMASNDIQDNIEEKLDEIRELRSDIDDLRKKLGQLEIKTTVDGIIAYFEMKVGDTVRSGEWVGSIFNVESMQMWAQVDDIDILNVRVDAPVRVTVDALPGEIFEGKVSHVDTRGERENNGITTYSVYIDVKGSDLLKPGMQAKGFIDAGSAEGVLLAPLEGVFEEEGKTVVEILDENEVPKLVPVKLGLMNDRIAEVKEGLKAGDRIITGSSADLLPSQHIGSKDTLLPNMKNDENSSKDNGKEN